MSASSNIPTVRCMLLASCGSGAGTATTPAYRQPRNAGRKSIASACSSRTGRSRSGRVASQAAIARASRSSSLVRHDLLDQLAADPAQVGVGPGPRVPRGLRTNVRDEVGLPWSLSPGCHPCPRSRSRLRGELHGRQLSRDERCDVGDGGVIEHERGVRVNLPVILHVAAQADGRRRVDPGLAQRDGRVDVADVAVEVERDAFDDPALDRAGLVGEERRRSSCEPSSTRSRRRRYPPLGGASVTLFVVAPGRMALRLATARIRDIPGHGQAARRHGLQFSGDERCDVGDRGVVEHERRGPRRSASDPPTSPHRPMVRCRVDPGLAHAARVGSMSRTRQSR